MDFPAWRHPRIIKQDFPLIGNDQIIARPFPLMKPEITDADAGMNRSCQIPQPAYRRIAEIDSPLLVMIGIKSQTVKALKKGLAEKDEILIRMRVQNRFDFI